MVINFKEGVKARNENALLHLLADKDADYQKRVLAVAVEYGFKTNDPLFLVMLATGQLQVILEDKPQELKHLFERWSEAIHDHLETAKRTAIKGQEIEIRRMVDRLIAHCEAKERSRLRIMLPAFGLLMVAIGFGVLLGLSVPVWLSGGYVPGQKITQDEAETLHWAKSPSGQLAQNIITWNSESLTNLNCTRVPAQQSLVAREKGSREVSNYCLLRVKPVR